MAHNPATAGTSIKRAVPVGYTVHRESTTEVLLAEDRDVFINPIQEFNRDLSTLAIKTWSELFDKEKQKKWQLRRENRSLHQLNKKKRKLPQSGMDGNDDDNHDGDAHHDADEPVAKRTDLKGDREATGDSDQHRTYQNYHFTAFEGLSATGLRSIRYAKEIPLLRSILANDLSAQAAANIQKNVDWNLGIDDDTQLPEASKGANDIKASIDTPKVRVSQGDCCSVLYAHRTVGSRFDVIDLDPYGTAAPFIDGAVQAVNDGGLLCITCTDLAVLAGANYSEKCYSNYGGSPIKGEYTHEGALRLLLHTVATSAARYGRYIVPLLSLSIDYYIRVFVRVWTGPAEVKQLASKTSLVYVCHQCQAFHLQRMGKSTLKENVVKNTRQWNFGLAAGPPCESRCEHCGGSFSVAGPMWLGSLHSPEFIDDLLQGIDASALATAPRIKGMLTLAKHEIASAFYFTPSRVASAFHATSPPLTKVAAALGNAGYKVSRSHACAGSIKTDAPIFVVFDVMREWIKSNPVKMDNIKSGSPARVLLSHEQKHTVDWTRNADAEAAMLAHVKIVRYQQNPTANWGPQAKANPNSQKRQKVNTADSNDVQ